MDGHLKEGLLAASSEVALGREGGGGEGRGKGKGRKGGWEGEVKRGKKGAIEGRSSGKRRQESR